MSNDRLDRSEFFHEGLRSLLGWAGKLAGDVAQVVADQEEQIPPLRPPGAIAESAFLRACTRCDRCAEACPHGAIIIADEESDTAAGTPIVVPADGPCRMCEGLPCIEACDTGALVATDRISIGTAHVRMSTCLAYQGQICDYCFAFCRRKGEAIVMESRKPRVIEAQCDGCGVCEHACPAPGGAITVAPTVHDRLRA